eukprot:963672-Rhodomonas_salina.2
MERRLERRCVWTASYRRLEHLFSSIYACGPQLLPFESASLTRNRWISSARPPRLDKPGMALPEAAG